MILVTGSNGQLGADVIKELERRKLDFIAATRKDFDIADYDETERFILKFTPECIIHCAAYTAVDKAEDEKELCYRVNVIGTENIAKACTKIDCKMIYVSTDYVFDGQGEEPHKAYDRPDPISVYGQTKYQGELKVQEYLEKYFIVRTSWVYGSNGNNFVKTMLRQGREKDTLNVVSDQIGSPTYTVDLAKLLCDMAMTDKYGIYHGTNEGFCSWAEFAEEIMKTAELKCKINYIKTSEYPTKAVRPLNSRLSKKNNLENGFGMLPEWRNALGRYFAEFYD